MPTTVSDLAHHFAPDNPGAMVDSIIGYLGHLSGLTADSELDAADEAMAVLAFGNPMPKLEWTINCDNGDICELTLNDDLFEDAGIDSELIEPSEDPAPYAAAEQRLLDRWGISANDVETVWPG